MQSQAGAHLIHHNQRSAELQRAATHHRLGHLRRQSSRLQMLRQASARLIAVVRRPTAPKVRRAPRQPAR